MTELLLESLLVIFGLNAHHDIPTVHSGPQSVCLQLVPEDTEGSRSQNKKMQDKFEEPRKMVPRFGPGVAEGANLTKGEGEDTTVSNMMTYGRIVNPSEKF